MDKHLLSIFFLLTAIINLPTTMSAQTNILDNYKWKNRLVLLFTPDVENQDYESQQALVKDAKEEYRERDLVVLSFQQGDDNGKGLRDRFNINEDKFTFILIGKDGSEKLRKYIPVNNQLLFDLIDSMPMRQSEMKDGKN